MVKVQLDCCREIAIALIDRVLSVIACSSAPRTRAAFFTRQPPSATINVFLAMFPPSFMKSGAGRKPMLRYFTAGESHGEMLVACLSALPAALQIDQPFIAPALRRRHHDVAPSCPPK